LILFTIEQVGGLSGRVLTVDRDGGLSTIDQIPASYVTIICVCQPLEEPSMESFADTEAPAD